jgi:D-amino-acid dehydrogenase
MLQEIKWGLGFLSRARPSILHETALALDALIRSSIAAHRQLMQAAGIAHRLREDGWIYLYRDAQALVNSRMMREVFDQFEVDTQELDPAALSGLEPHLRPIFQRALWIKDACTVDDPGQVVQAYARLFQARGGELVQAEIVALQRETQGRWQLRVPDGSVRSASQVVIALGPWANDLLAPLKLAAPLAFERGYHQNFVAHADARLGRPVYDRAVGYVLAPMEGGVRLTTGVELTQRDAPPNLAQLRTTELAAREAFPLGAPAGTPWLGSRPTLPDSRPLIGAAPGHTGLWLALGHQHIGLCTGPGTAQLLAALMLGETCSIEPAPFRPERFIA